MEVVLLEGTDAHLLGLREGELLHDAQLTLLTERRRFAPYGASGGESGQTGRNLLIRADEEIELAGKTTRPLQAGDILRIETPGGGGYGPARDREQK